MTDMTQTTTQPPREPPAQRTAPQIEELEYRPIIFAHQNFQRAIDLLRSIAAFPLPEDPQDLHDTYGRRLYHTDAIKAARAVREALSLLGMPC